MEKGGSRIVMQAKPRQGEKGESCFYDAGGEREKRGEGLVVARE